MHFRFDFAFRTGATPEQVLSAFTDFTPERLEIWKGTLEPTLYEVLELGETWALAKEGSVRPTVWALERYQWTVPGVEPRRVRWNARSSNFCSPGSGVEISVTGGPDGSVVAGTWQRGPSGLRGLLLVPLARIAAPRQLIPAWAEALDRYAAAASRSGGRSRP